MRARGPGPCLHIDQPLRVAARAERGEVDGVGRLPRERARVLAAPRHVQRIADAADGGEAGVRDLVQHLHDAGALAAAVAAAALAFRAALARHPVRRGGRSSHGGTHAVTRSASLQVALRQPRSDACVSAQRCARKRCSLCR